MRKMAYWIVRLEGPEEIEEYSFPALYTLGAGETQEHAMAWMTDRITVPCRIEFGIVTTCWGPR